MASQRTPIDDDNLASPRTTEAWRSSKDTAPSKEATDTDRSSPPEQREGQRAASDDLRDYEDPSARIHE